jgi:hypothetical protein
MIKQNSISQVRSLGIDVDDAWALRRISMTLRRWYEHECNGAIQRDGDRGDGLPFWHSTYDGRKLYRAPDRERGALKRLASIMARYPDLKPYVQGDPRGCALYILRPNDVPEGKGAGAYYNRGIAVY